MSLPDLPPAVPHSPTSPPPSLQVRPPHVVLVHGEKTEMMRLKGALEKTAAEKDIPRAVYTPAVMQTVKVGSGLGGIRRGVTKRSDEKCVCREQGEGAYLGGWIEGMYVL